MDVMWTGNVRDLVTEVAGSDARSTYVDKATGAKIRINIEGGDFKETDEPFYIEYGENLYDATNRKEAMSILSNIRKGERYPDTPSHPKKHAHKATHKKSSRRHSVGSGGLGTMR
jgi:hypothetical protein